MPAFDYDVLITGSGFGGTWPRSVPLVSVIRHAEADDVVTAPSTEGDP